MSRKRLIILIAAVLIIGGIILKKAFSAIPVTKVNVEHVQVEKTVSASGSVVSKSEADLSFQTPGQISQVFVKEGQEVSKGTVVAGITNTGPSADLQAVKSSLDAAKKDLDIYIENYSTNASAVGGENEYWLNVRRLEDLVNRAQANYQSQLATFGKTYVYALFAGTIVDVYKDTGESAGLGDPIVKIADLENLVFEITVDQEDFGLLNIGQSVEVVLDAYEEEVFAGVVESLPSYASATTEEFTINITLVQNSEAPALLGMTGDARIITQTTTGEVQALTFDQIMQDDAGYFVWISENGILKKLPIEIGLEGDLYTEVKTDLTDVTIVTSKDTQIPLKEGIKVKVVE